jgi:hypothetical protein
MLNHTYDYRTTLEASERVNWKLEDVIAGRRLDFTKPFLPESLAGVEGIGCLAAGEKLKLNQIRGFTYLYLFGLCEEYILPSVIEYAGKRVHGDDDEMRALLHFAGEEAKHIQLFKWFVKEFERGFGTPCGAIGPVEEIAGAILNHSRLGIFLATLQIEWMTQRHYEESVRDDAGRRLDPLFTSLLKHHWLEESQHAKIDTLVVERIASALRPAQIEAAIGDYLCIGKLLDGGLTMQVELDLESLEKAIGRTLSAGDRAEIARAQTRAYRFTFLESGMTHPRFDRSLRELSARGHERVGERARAIA